MYIDTLARIALYLDTDVAHSIVTGDFNWLQRWFISWFCDFLCNVTGMSSYTAESYLFDCTL